MNLIKFCVLFCVCAPISFLFLFCFGVQMSPFKALVVKGGNNKGKEPVIDVDDPSPRSRRIQSSTGVCEPDKFRSYVPFQTYENCFREALLLVERVVD